MTIKRCRIISKEVYKNNLHNKAISSVYFRPFKITIFKCNLLLFTQLDLFCLLSVIKACLIKKMVHTSDNYNKKQ